MGILQELFARLTSAFRTFSPPGDDPPAIHVLKRPRLDDPTVDDTSPPKRRRFDARPRPALADITQMSNSDDDVVVVDNTVSPSKFKNAYKAPKHVRSRKVVDSTVVDLTVDDSARRRRSAFKPPEDLTKDEYCRLLGSMISEDGKRIMRRRSAMAPPTVDLTVDVVDLTDEPPKRVDLTNEKRADLTNEQRVDLTNERFSRPRFGRVDLTSLVLPSTSSASVAVRPKYLADNPSFLADSTKFSFYRPDTPLKLVDKVKHLDNSLHLPVNSFQKRIDKFKWSRDDYLAKFREASAKLSENARKIGEQLEAESKCAAAVAEEAITDRIEQGLRAHLKITDALLEEEEVESETVLPTLDDAMLAKIRYAQNRSLSQNEVLVTKYRLDIRRSDLLTLSGLSWLNDNVINFYMEMIAERSQNHPKYPKVYAFNTFFYSTLSSSGYQRVRRFTKKVDIFEKDIILVPVHLSVHWCMAKIDMKKKQVVYFDSMLTTNKNALDTLLDYVASEHKDKKNEILDMSGWTAHCDKTVPQQQNGSDCGVFACTFAEYSARNAKFSFSQENMPYLRMRMVYEICTGELLIK